MMGAEIPLCQPPLSFDDFFEHKNTPSSFRSYAVLALQQLSCRSKKRAKDFAAQALKILNSLPDIPNVVTAAGLVVMSTYLVTTGEYLRGYTMLDLADDMLVFLMAARRHKYSSEVQEMAEYIRIYRLRMTTYKYFKMTKEYFLDRRWQKHTLRLMYNKYSTGSIEHKKNIPYRDTLLLKLIVEGLIEVEVNLWFQTGDVLHWHAVFRYIRVLDHIITSVPQYSIYHFYACVSIARAYNLFNVPAEALKYAEKARLIAMRMIKGKRIYPIAVYKILSLWKIFVQYGSTKEAEEIMYAIKELASDYPAVHVHLEHVIKFGLLYPPTAFIEITWLKTDHTANLNEHTSIVTS